MATTRQKISAELLGTFALVFAGTTAIVVNHGSGAVTQLGVALIFGLIVFSMISAIGDISGAHMNPAVTLGFWWAGRIPSRTAALYIIAQCFGAISASLIVRALFSATAQLGATLPSGTASQSFVMEGLMTAGLMFVILNVSTGAKEKGITAAAAVGGMIALEALLGGPVSGASMNPARSLAPALVGWNFSALWIYLIAPPLGAIVAVFACRMVREKGCCDGRCQTTGAT